MKRAHACASRRLSAAAASAPAAAPAPRAPAASWPLSSPPPRGARVSLAPAAVTSAAGDTGKYVGMTGAAIVHEMVREAGVRLPVGTASLATLGEHVIEIEPRSAPGQWCPLTVRVLAA